MSLRPVRQVLQTQSAVEGAGVKLQRAFGFGKTKDFDPFLLLDDFRNDNPEDYLAGFPWHPHRGIETITYVLEGRVEHGDSMGTRGVISGGDVQWMTAGSGIIHQEMPKGREDGVMWGFQLWANLPAARKMTEPRYQEVRAAEIPEAALGNGVRAKVVCGAVDGVQGPVRDVAIDPQYLDVTVPPGTTFTFPVEQGRRAFTYVVSGRAYFEPERDPYAYDVEGANYFDFKRDCLLGPENAVLFDNSGDELAITTGEEAARFLLVTGRPLGEPVAWYGPIVMNTQEELRQAFQELREGTFLKE